MLGELPLILTTILFVASLATRNGLLLFVSLAVLLVALVSRLWERHCFTGVEYRRHFSQRRAFFGEEVELTVEVVNRKVLPLAWLEVEDEVPGAVSFLSGRLSASHKAGRNLLMNLFSLRWYERIRRRYRLRCDARGYHTFGPIRLRSGDLFGFTTKDLVLEQEDHILVYPRVVPVTQLGLPARDPFGDRRSRQRLFEDPLSVAGIREYRYGDSLRRVHWKATARAQQLQVKLYEPTTTYRLVIFLNMNTFGEDWWSFAFDHSLLEFSITVAASVASWAMESGYQVGLYANGNARKSDSKVAIPASRDPEQLTHILEALAAVLPFAAMPLEDLIASESWGLPYGSTLVVVTAVLNDEIVARLSALGAAGHRLTLLLIGDHVPPITLPGITVYRIGGEEAWRDLAALAVGAG
ncbi:MAG: DUF58 domain-containing protein [Chloroflexota bacterium]